MPDWFSIWLPFFLVLEVRDEGGTSAESDHHGVVPLKEDMEEGWRHHFPLLPMATPTERGGRKPPPPPS